MNPSFPYQILSVIQPASGLKAPPVFRLPPIASLHWGLFKLKAFGFLYPTKLPVVPGRTHCFLSCRDKMLVKKEFNHCYRPSRQGRNVSRKYEPLYPRSVSSGTEYDSFYSVHIPSLTGRT
ncbi:MAG: hypothetical protein LBG15_12400, partial [Dysgonamonadaceae bacterium]|nr:hypothetical protein [Dysgonamonadaceae bacterium]